MDLEESNTRSGRDIKLCFKDHGKRYYILLLSLVFCPIFELQFSLTLML